MVWYNRGKHIILDATAVTTESPLELLNDRILVALMKTSYSINIDTHDHFDDISASEIVATGYAARGDNNPLAGKSSNQDNVNDRGEFDANDLTYTAIGNGTNDTFDQIVVMREADAGATDANTELIAHTTVSSTLTNGGNITLQWNSEGILHITT